MVIYKESDLCAHLIGAVLIDILFLDGIVIVGERY